MNSLIKRVIAAALILSIVTAVGVYLAIPHPEVVEIIRNPYFYKGTDATRYSNTTVVVRNHGADGWVKVLAIYQVVNYWGDTGTTALYQVIYMLNAEKSKLQYFVDFTNIAQTNVEGDLLNFPQFSQARAEASATANLQEALSF
jgi:hypothetical protein